MSKALMKAGYEITLALPQIFEKEAQAFGVNYVLQTGDDIAGMVETAANIQDLLKWMQGVIDKQFEQYIPIAERHDILIASNTEFAAPSIAEYCKKPFIRTAFAPLIPGLKIPPPVMPLPKPHPIIKPWMLWKLLNIGLNLMTRKILNRHRIKRGLSAVKDYGEYNPAFAHNFLMFSRYLGNTDPDWKYKWDIGGYCFNDDVPYDQAAYADLQRFIKSDNRPILFFTLGSCNTKKRDQLCEWLFEICLAQGYKFIVGSGWWRVGSRLDHKDSLYIMESFIPHNLIFPACDAVIHHGGSGTSHSAARAGKPQMMVPLIIDQFYWGYRVSELGIGPKSIKISRVSKKELKRKVLDLMNNPDYKKNAAALGKKVRSEKGVRNFTAYIQKFAAADMFPQTSARMGDNVV
jgi:UDP:flavonoid glycosyltransferase YjiC (YdhE family)